MRILKTATYILATLAICGLSYQSQASTNFNFANNKPEVSNYEAHNNDAETLPKQLSEIPKTIAQQVPLVSVRAADLAQALTFPDIQGNWAQSFIQALVARNIVQGFPDGTFRPEQPVTRAQFAAIISKAFQKNSIREAITFVDVPQYYWANEAIRDAYQKGFLAGYPNNVFLPNQNIARVQVLVSLANGLQLSTTADTAAVLSNSYQDAAQIPNFARIALAAATENRLVVNYPNRALLKPNQVATRADVAAFIYQALASTGEVPQLSSTDVTTQYIVGYESVVEPPTQTPEQLADLRAQFRLPVPPLIEVLRTGSFGGSTVSSPTAFGVDFGDAFIGASFQERTRRSSSADGTVSVGFGLGDARRAVGLETAVSIVDLLGDTFEDGTISFKVHRLLSDSLAIAFGVENAVTFGSTDGGTSAYGVASKVFTLQADPAELFSRLTISLGVGSGRFRSEDDIENDEGSINPFGSVGLQVARPVSLIADWTGQDLNLGVSIVPFQRTPLVITPAVADVTGNAGDGARFILGIGYGISF